MDSNVSVLTERDRLLVEAGYLPVDVDFHRRLTEQEVAQAKADREGHNFSEWPNPDMFVPHVHRGVLCFLPKD